MEKIITFKEYNFEKQLNSDRLCSEIFNSAWNKTEQGIKYNKMKKNIIKTCQITCVCAVSFIIISNFLAIDCFANTANIELLKSSYPKLYVKFKNIANIFQQNLIGLDYQQQKQMLNDLIMKNLNMNELKLFYVTFKESTYAEMFNFFKNL